MAIYRPARRRWRAPVGAAIGGLLLGLIVGFLLWGRQEPDPVEALGRVRAELQAAAGGLEVLSVEYAESVEGGEVVRRSEYGGALAALARSRQRYLMVAHAVRAIDPAAASEADSLYGELLALTRGRASGDDVTSTAEELIEILRGVVGD